jgi:hypothetical protein
VVEYRKAVQQAGPNHIVLWMLSDKLGMALLELNRDAEAKEAFETSLRVNPLDLEAHLHLAGILLKEDPYRAWLHLRECLRLNPLDPRVHRLSHRAARRLGKEGDTREDWATHRKRHAKALTLLRGHEPGVKASTEPEGSTDPAGAFLRIVSLPWARVWLDYVDTGLTTPVYGLRVAPGTHVVGLVAECLKEPRAIRVQARRGETVVIDEKLCETEPGTTPP